MSPDARRRKKRRDITEAPVVGWVLGLPPKWQTALGVAMILVAIAGLYQLCGVSDKLTPLPPLPTATATLLPGSTAVATVTVAAAPVGTVTPTPEPQIAIGGHVVIYGTGEAKLRCRAGPGLAEELVIILDEGTRLTIMDGPVPVDDYEWWKIKTEDGQVGWAAGDWLLPVSD